MNKGRLGLPFEVLAYIFLIECPALSSNSDGHKALDPFPYLARMGSVCQHWRQVVLQTPRLWSTVHYLLDINRATYGPEKWQTIVKRSGDVDLAVCIWHQDTPWCEVGFPEERLVGDRISLFHILRRARIIVIHNTSCHDGYQFIPNWTITFVPRLQHLIVYTDHPPVRDILLLPVALQSMSYSTPYELDAIERKCITQCSPKRLSLRINSLEGILLDMLESLAYLKELSLKYNIERHSRPFSHSNLIHLTITSKHVSPSRILGALPNLIHLKLCPRRPGTKQERDHSLVVPRALPPLTALRSLTVEPEAPQYSYVHEITTVVDRAPALIALEVWDENALEVVSRFAGVAIGPDPELTDAAEDAPSYLRGTVPPATMHAYESLRLIRIGFAHPKASEWVKPMSVACAELLKRRPDVRIEWRALKLAHLYSGIRRKKEEERGRRVHACLAHAPEGVDVGTSSWHPQSEMC